MPGGQATGAAGLLVLLLSGELQPSNVVYFCVAASNAVGLLAGEATMLQQASLCLFRAGFDKRWLQWSTLMRCKFHVVGVEGEIIRGGAR